MKRLNDIRLLFCLIMAIGLAIPAKTLAQDDDCFAPAYRQGLALMDQAKYDEAIKWFEAAKDCPTAPEGNNAQAKIEECERLLAEANVTLTVDGLSSVNIRFSSSSNIKILSLSSVGHWEIVDVPNWVKCTRVDSVSFSITCVPNPDSERQCLIHVVAGKQSVPIHIIQEGKETDLLESEEYPYSGSEIESMKSACINGSESIREMSSLFMSLQYGGHYAFAEHPFSLSHSAQFSMGVRFSSILSTRIAFSGWESTGGWGVELSKANGVADAISYKFNYVAGALDLMLNAINLFDKRHHSFDLYVFFGGGVNYAFNNGEAINIASLHPYLSMDYLWADHYMSPLCHFGMMSYLDCTDRMSVTFEINHNIVSDKFNSKNGGNPDRYINALLGVCFAI